jgi:preprotein translocase subunit SecY
MFAVLAIGWRIPLPGLDLESVKPVYGEVPATLSIFALGLVPLFTILGYAEIAKLAVPQLTRWQTRSIRNARRFAVIVYALSLVLTAWQGYGLLMALGAVDIVRSDAVGFVPAGLAAFIASTALIVWLADDFGFSELGSGFWVLMAIPFLVEFPSQASALIRPIQMGAISGGHVLIGGLSLVIGMALVVIANLLLSCNGGATGVAKTSILLWPPYLASGWPDMPFFCSQPKCRTGHLLRRCSLRSRI